ncbi:MAG: hypothetical protein K2L48_03050 [Mycoplasmoidaceae bacterium]|nr:hypothetical protein [Mycoplasmoidaceae bacterium]
MGEKRLEYNAHKALNNSTKIAEYKYPVIITVMSVFQFAAQALLDCILPN